MIFNANTANEKPIESVIITSTNENPSSIYGGTWELVDKEYKCEFINGSDLFTLSENATSCDSNALLSGHTVRLRMTIVNSVELADTSVILGNINFDKIGVKTIGYTMYNVPTFADVGDAIVAYNIAYTDGTLTCTDVLGKTNHVLPVGRGGYIDVTFTLTHDNMLDEFCDKFYWKKVA